MKKGFDAMNEIANQLISKIEKNKLTFDAETGELIKVTDNS